VAKATTSLLCTLLLFQPVSPETIADILVEHEQIRLWIGSFHPIELAGLSMRAFIQRTLVLEWTKVWLEDIAA
jgi:hypothetical protein